MPIHDKNTQSSKRARQEHAEIAMESVEEKCFRGQDASAGEAREVVKALLMVVCVPGDAEGHCWNRGERGGWLLLLLPSPSIVLLGSESASLWPLAHRVSFHANNPLSAMPRTRGAVKPAQGGPAPIPAPALDRSAASSSMPTKRPPIRRASSAMPALPPTPPRTTHKRKRRSRSRVTDSSSEEEDAHEVPIIDSDDEDERGSGEPERKVGALVLGHKRRRVLTLDAIAEELSEATAEDAFWMGTGGPESSSRHSGMGSSESKPKQLPTGLARAEWRSAALGPGVLRAVRADICTRAQASPHGIMQVRRRD
ncbi:hypothetical protein NUW54_g10729 [Trametes sanguinea]|uniref:Uncharacterized protein n=1 Tax=Trametes sanguinea TaxID=158606 RepID=A0ACC1NTJ1_9APHY|nr:hypothetical protein NUW54_g10729 [Trametes sanguinea]